MKNLNLDAIRLSVNEFLAKNKQINKSKLADMLGVSSGTLTSMNKKGLTRMQALAIAELDKRISEHNLIELDITEWFHKSEGNRYFSGYIYFQGKRYFMPFQYGYGSHCEQVAIELLFDKGLLPSGSYGDLFRYYNTRVIRNTTEVSRKIDLYEDVK